MRLLIAVLLSLTLVHAATLYIDVPLEVESPFNITAWVVDGQGTYACNASVDGDVAIFTLTDDAEKEILLVAGEGVFDVNAMCVQGEEELSDSLAILVTEGQTTDELLKELNDGQDLEENTTENIPVEENPSPAETTEDPPVETTDTAEEQSMALVATTEDQAEEGINPVEIKQSPTIFGVDMYLFIYGGVIFICLVLGVLGVVYLLKYHAPKQKKQDPPTVEDTQANTIKTFIERERWNGFDDLEIRTALLQRGWDPVTVDQVFDSIYKVKK